MSQVSLGRPEFVPGTPPGHPTAKFLYYFARSPETFCEYFFRICLGILHWKMAGIFGEFFLVSVSHETRHEKSSKNSGKIRSKIRGKNSGRKFEKFGKLSFCNFFWPNSFIWFFFIGFFSPYSYSFLKSSRSRRETPRELFQALGP